MRQPHRRRQSRREEAARSGRHWLAWIALVAAGGAVAAWFAWERSYKSGGVAVAVLGVAMATAIAISAWPRSAEPGLAATLVGLALAAIGTGAGLMALHKDHKNNPLKPPAQVAPPGLPRSGPTLKIWNKVTDGARLMRDDREHPAYLSTVRRNYCKKNQCAIPGTDLQTGDSVGPAVCQGRGDRATNGNEASNVDDHNPGLYSSTLWYGVMRTDGTLGYIHEVWVRPSQHGGLDLRPCPPAP